MTKNVGTVDRIIRVLIAVGLVVAGIILAPMGMWWIAILAIVPLLTAGIAVCPLYLPLRISTISVKKYKG